MESSKATLGYIFAACIVFMFVSSQTKADDSTTQTLVLKGNADYFCFIGADNPNQITCTLDVIKNETLSAERPKSKAGEESKDLQGEKSKTSKGAFAF